MYTNSVVKNSWRVELVDCCTGWCYMHVQRTLAKVVPTLTALFAHQSTSTDLKSIQSPTRIPTHSKCTHVAIYMYHPAHKSAEIGRNAVSSTYQAQVSQTQRHVQGTAMTRAPWDIQVYWIPSHGPPPPPSTKRRVQWSPRKAKAGREAEHGTKPLKSATQGARAIRANCEAIGRQERGGRSVQAGGGWQPSPPMVWPRASLCGLERQARFQQGTGDIYASDFGVATLQNWLDNITRVDARLNVLIAPLLYAAPTVQGEL